MSLIKRLAEPVTGSEHLKYQGIQTQNLLTGYVFVAELDKGRLKYIKYGEPLGANFLSSSQTFFSHGFLIPRAAKRAGKHTMNSLGSLRALTMRKVTTFHHRGIAINSVRPFNNKTDNNGQPTMWFRQKTVAAYSSTPRVFSHPCISYKDRAISTNWRMRSSQLHSSTFVQAVKMAGGSNEDTEILSYKLRDSCALFLHQGDITKWFVNGENDAIVNAANERMLGGGGVDGAIHRAAGPELLRACRIVPEVQPGVRCPAGSARITKAFNLPASHIIHTVGPIYNGQGDSARVLSSAYKSSLEVAEENHIKYVAFPAISCGVYGYPAEEAAVVALSTLQNHAGDLEEVHFVLFDLAVWKAWLEKADELLEKKH